MSIVDHHNAINFQLEVSAYLYEHSHSDEGPILTRRRMDPMTKLVSVDATERKFKWLLPNGKRRRPAAVACQMIFIVLSNQIKVAESNICPIHTTED